MKVTIHNKPTIFINKDFKTLQIKVFYTFKKEDPNIALFHILPGLLHNVTCKYPTEKEFNLKAQELYILSIICNCYTLGDMAYYVFDLVVPDVISLNKDLLDEQIEFLKEMIYNPKTQNGVFCDYELQREVKNIKISIEKILQDNERIASVKAKELLDPEGSFSSSLYRHREKIDEVNVNNLFDFYKEKICNNQPIVYIFGNVNKKRIDDLFYKHFSLNKYSTKTIEVNNKNYLPLKKEMLDIVEESNFKNSIYITYYVVKDMCEDDEVLLAVVRELLSSSSSRVLYKKLRLENDLVYHSYSSSYGNYGVLGIVALINKNHYEAVKDKIKESLMDLKNHDLVEENFKKILERHRISLIRNLDNKSYLFRNEIFNSTKIDLTEKEIYEKMLSLKTEDICNFIDRLIPQLQYFLKEGEHE